MDNKRKFGFREKFVAASALIALIIFVLLMYYLPEGKRAWSWLVFLLVPLSPFITGLQKIRLTYPMIVVIVYLVLGFAINWWHPGWILFITIPIFYIFFPHGFKKDAYIEENVTEEDKKEFYDL